MNADDGTPSIPDSVRETLCRDPDVEFVLGFGSRIEGDHRSLSDLDVAVKFSDDLSSEERFRKRCRLSGKLQRSDLPFVDLSDIDELSLEFAHAAVGGEFVCGDEDLFREHKRTIESEFEDRREEIERRQREVISRIAEEGLHG